MTEKTSIIDWRNEVCSQVLDEWNKGREYVSDLDELYDDLYRMLRGERPIKNYDWESNVVINKIFQVIWAAVPYMAQKIFGATPKIGVDSFDKVGAWEREKILEFWHTLQAGPDKEHVPFFIITVMMLLRGMLNGVSFMKKGWHQKLKTKTFEQQIAVPMTMDAEGNEIDVEPHTIKRKQTIPVEDWPSNSVVNNKDIVGDWLLKPGESIRQGRFIIHREMHDLNSLEQAGLYENLNEIAVTVDTSDSTLRQDHASVTDLDDQGSVPTSDIYVDVEVYERQGIRPVYRADNEFGWKACLDKEKAYTDDNVQWKEMVVTTAKMAGSENTNNILIRFEPNPYGEKNIIDLHLYLDPERWNSMGMAEPIKDLQVMINDNINAMFDEIWRNLAPPTIVNKFALWDWDTMLYAPRQRWLVGGNPAESILPMPPQNVTRDAWQKHAMFDNEIQTTTVANAVHGMGKEKTATTNVLNAQMTTGKLDFLIKMVEVTFLIPSAQMDMRFAKKFAHQLTLQMIVGRPFKFNDWEDIYRYVPAASSVKTEEQKEVEIQQDIQLLQIAANIPNPNTPKILNKIWSNILRNRDMPVEAALFDEEFFEPQSEGGQMQMLKRQLQGRNPQNQNMLPMSGTEKGVRQRSFA